MKKRKNISRRGFIKNCVRITAVVSLTLGAGVSGLKSLKQKMFWQIDPDKCVQCGRCATECVLNPSAVKCIHAYAVCGYCDLCSGYFKPKTFNLNTGAENQLCPTGAIKRTYIEDPYYEYIINEKFCIGCSKCVAGCSSFGNASLFLQIKQNLCLHCNECSISKVCPSGAIKQVSEDTQYLLKGVRENG